MYGENQLITPDMVAIRMKDNDDINISFKNKHFIPEMKEEDVYDMAFDETVDSTKDLVDFVYKSLLSNSFKRFVTNALFDMEEANDR